MDGLNLRDIETDDALLDVLSLDYQLGGFMKLPEEARGDLVNAYLASYHENGLWDGVMPESYRDRLRLKHARLNAEVAMATLEGRPVDYGYVTSAQPDPHVPQQVHGDVVVQ